MIQGPTDLFWVQFNPYLSRWKTLEGKAWNHQHLDFFRAGASVGLLAVEESLRSFWEESTQNWNELRALLKALLADEDVVAEMAVLSGSLFSPAQWYATLSFLEMIDDPKDYAPSFSDLALLKLIQTHAPETDSALLDFLALLFKLQRLQRFVRPLGPPPTRQYMEDLYRSLDEFWNTAPSYLYGFPKTGQAKAA